MSQDPYSDPVTGVLYNRLELRSAAALEAAEREITHAALILLDESPVPPSYDLPHLRGQWDLLQLVGAAVRLAELRAGARGQVP